MDRTTIIALLIEAAITLIPLATALIKIGGWKKGMEQDIIHLKDGLIEQKLVVSEMKSSLDKINKSLVEINTLVQLLVGNRIKTHEESK